MPLHALEPKALWSHFAAICGIPRKSGCEQAIGEWLLLRAHSWGLESSRDDVGNIIIRKKASAGCEQWPGVILQAHMDMVCQARPGIAHDFAVDPIHPHIPEERPEWLYARGTTLGADNGIGMAAILAVLESATLQHGPLEALFTVNEEDGMTGARGLSAASLHGTYLLNLDSENMDELTIGCAGALRCTIVMETSLVAPGQGLAWYELKVSGLAGGHSGIDIAKGRGNANRALVRLLLAAPRKLQLATMQGGTALNAIPREATALFAVPAAEEAFLATALEAAALELSAELANGDPAFQWQLKRTAAVGSLLPEHESGRLLDLIHKLPNGLIAMESELADAIRTSLNLGIMSLAARGTTAAHAELSVMIRSSSESEKNSLAETLTQLSHAAGAELRRGNNNPSWQPERASPLVQKAEAVYRQVFGSAPRIAATHGGLECGLFRPLYPEWQMISFGPDIQAPHSPDECLHIPSVTRFWDYLAALLAELR
ncbi:MAG: beta-Ala-His dipeptidase [Spirochaetes bacterium]|nr:beta-Ala-His dipeptidase [Spirochaetota bacterium]MBU0954506.1 beta-Ala-His dipeptidase [Spirochaetota bacterium]